jgi:hypothetical protein
MMGYRPFHRDTASSRFHGVQIHARGRAQLDMTAVQLTILDAWNGSLRKTTSIGAHSRTGSKRSTR